MNTIIEICEKHFSKAEEDLLFRQWAFGRTNLGDHTNCSLIDLWNQKHGDIEIYGKNQYLLWVVLKMIYRWREALGQQGNCALVNDEQIAKEKQEKEEKTNTNLSNRIGVMEVEMDKLKREFQLIRDYGVTYSPIRGIM